MWRLLPTLLFSVTDALGASLLNPHLCHDNDQTIGYRVEWVGEWQANYEAQNMKWLIIIIILCNVQ